MTQAKLTTSAVLGDSRCECSDSGCFYCEGHCKETASTILYRIDMEDITGSAFCEGCADDAWDSGLFAEQGND